MAVTPMVEHPQDPPDSAPSANAPAQGEPLEQTLQRIRAALKTTTDPSLAGQTQAFEKIFEHLPEAASRMMAAYKEICSRHGLQTGTVRLYMFGGRVMGKPLTQESDIDLAFCIEHYQQSPERLHFDRFPDPHEADQFRVDVMGEIRNAITTICAEMRLTDEFQIHSFGAAMTNAPSHDAVILAEA